MISRLLMLILTLVSMNATAQIIVSQTEGIRIEMNSQVTPIPLNQMHSWVITLRTPADEPLENATIGIEGGMPEHNHGLATSPEVTDYLGEGKYLVEGLRFHMPGEWLLELQIEHQGRRYQSEASFQVGTELVRPFRIAPN